MFASILHFPQLFRHTNYTLPPLQQQHHHTPQHATEMWSHPKALRTSAPSICEARMASNMNEIQGVSFHWSCRHPNLWQALFLHVFSFCGMSDCQKTMFCMDGKTISGKYPLHLKRSLGKGWKSETSLWHEALHLFTKLSCSYQFVPFESLKVLSHQVHCPTAIQQESNSHAMKILLVEHVETSKHHEKPAVSKIGHSWHTWVFPKIEVPQNRWWK